MSLGYAFQSFGIFECFVCSTLAVVVIIVIVIVIVIGCVTFEEVLPFGVGIISEGLGNSCQLYGRCECCVHSAAIVVVIVVVLCVSCEFVLLLDEQMALYSFCVAN